jgi:hypothetical protein
VLNKKHRHHSIPHADLPKPLITQPVFIHAPNIPTGKQYDEELLEDIYSIVSSTPNQLNNDTISNQPNPVSYVRT